MLPTFQSPVCRWFFEHWSTLPRTGLVPSSETFLDRAPATLMPHVFVHDLVAGGLMTRFMGTALVQRWNSDLTGQLFATELPKAERDKMIGQVTLITSQPCGLVQLGRFFTMAGRGIDFEAVLLPLSVASGRPARAVTFSQMLSTFDESDNPAGLEKYNQQTWIDLGAGVPARSPFEPD